MVVPPAAARRTARTWPRAAAALATAFVARACARRSGHAGVVEGRVVDEAGAPLRDVRVVVVELGGGRPPTSDGRFRFARPAERRLRGELLAGGARPRGAARRGARRGVVLAVGMRAARLELAAVQVTATPAATSAAASPQPVAVVEGAELRRVQGAALGETLEQVPGVRSLSMTTGSGSRSSAA
jgi:hypothetical protein